MTTSNQPQSQSLPAPRDARRRALARSAAIVTLMGVPLMVLLMYCAWLPFLMGMYFFLLGGLLLGGIWWRMARSIRPAPRRAVYGTMLMMLSAWTLVYLGSESLVKPRHFARDMANYTTHRVRVRSEQERHQRHVDARAHVYGVLASYGPGPIGYWAWVLADGTMAPMAPYGDEATLMKLPQRQGVWLVRVLASLLLLTYGLRLQAKELTRPEEPANAAPAPEETPTAA